MLVNKNNASHGFYKVIILHKYFSHINIVILFIKCI